MHIMSEMCTTFCFCWCSIYTCPPHKWYLFFYPFCYQAAKYWLQLLWQVPMNALLNYYLINFLTKTVSLRWVFTFSHGLYGHSVNLMSGNILIQYQLLTQAWTPFWLKYCLNGTIASCHDHHSDCGGHSCIVSWLSCSRNQSESALQ